MLLPPPRVLCLDLGDVVVRLCQSWGEAAARADLPDLLLAESSAERTRRLELVRAHTCGLLSNQAYFERLAALLAYRYSPVEVARIHDAWLLGEFPGIHELLLACQGRAGLQTACLSNTNARHWDRMSADARLPGEWRSFHSFQVRQASHLLGLAKPDPGIYHAFVRELAARPDEILFFDDREEHVEAARAAGWRAEQVLPGAEPAEQIAEGLRRHGVVL